MGVVKEILERLRNLGGSNIRMQASEPNEWRDGASFNGEECVNIDPELLKYVLNEMVLEAGVDLVMHSTVVGADVDGGVIKNLILEDKSGRHAVAGEMFVDTTGDADVAAFAGAPLNYDRHPWGVNIDFRLGGVDIAKERAFRDKQPEEHQLILNRLSELISGRMYWGPSVGEGIV